MGSTTRLDQKARTRKRIIDGAASLFSQNGYEAVTMRDLAAHCGVSTGAVFANFEDKAALFCAVTGRQAPPARLRAFLEGCVHGVMTEEARVLYADLYGVTP